MATLIKGKYDESTISWILMDGVACFKTGRPIDDALARNQPRWEVRSKQLDIHRFGWELRYVSSFGARPITDCWFQRDFFKIFSQFFTSPMGWWSPMMSYFPGRCLTNTCGGDAVGSSQHQAIHERLCLGMRKRPWLAKQNLGDGHAKGWSYLDICGWKWLKDLESLKPSQTLQF